MYLLVFLSPLIKQQMQILQSQMKQSLPVANKKETGQGYENG
jgi:hypothetical protein